MTSGSGGSITRWRSGRPCSSLIRSERPAGRRQAARRGRSAVPDDHQPGRPDARHDPGRGRGRGPADPRRRRGRGHAACSTTLTVATPGSSSSSARWSRIARSSTTVRPSCSRASSPLLKLLTQGPVDRPPRRSRGQVRADARPEHGGSYRPPEHGAATMERIPAYLAVGSLGSPACYRGGRLVRGRARRGARRPSARSRARAGLGTGISLAFPRRHRPAGAHPHRRRPPVRPSARPGRRRPHRNHRPAR